MKTKLISCLKIIFDTYFKISEELYFPHFTEGVESSGSKIFSMASKMVKVFGGIFYNTRALQRRLNQDHGMRRKKDTQGKRIFFQIFPTPKTLERF